MLFDNLLSKLRETVTQKLMTINVQDNNDPTISRVEIQRKQSPLIGDYAKAEAALRSEALNLATSDNKILRQDPLRTRQASMELDPNDPSTWGKISRNALCPCGSGKKYKRCHGKFQ